MLKKKITKKGQRQILLTLTLTLRVIINYKVSFSDIKYSQNMHIFYTV